MTRAMEQNILESYGYEIVGEAGSGASAIERYFECKPDIVTLDVVMPEGGGLVALHGIMERDPQAKIIMITAVDQRESLMEAIRAGAKDFIVKPFEEERVLSAVNKLSGVS